jgi:hypothetical protein
LYGAIDNVCLTLARARAFSAGNPVADLCFVDWIAASAAISAWLASRSDLKGETVFSQPGTSPVEGELIFVGSDGNAGGSKEPSSAIAEANA